MPEQDARRQPDQDTHARDHFDRMTRAYLRSILSDELISEHKFGDSGHFSEPLARLLAWCGRRPLAGRYAVKAESNGTFRLIKLAGKRGQKPQYLNDESYGTLREARHGVLLQHIRDLTEN